MKMQAVRALGRALGLSFPVGTTKMEAIRAIQRAEGNFDCYGRANEAYCDQAGCLFREECLRVSGKPGPGVVVPGVRSRRESRIE